MTMPDGKFLRKKLKCDDKHAIGASNVCETMLSIADPSSDPVISALHPPSQFEGSEDSANHSLVQVILELCFHLSIDLSDDHFFCSIGEGFVLNDKLLKDCLVGVCSRRVW